MGTYTSKIVANIQSHQLLPIYQGPPRTRPLPTIAHLIDSIRLGTIAERRRPLLASRGQGLLQRYVHFVHPLEYRLTG